MGHPCLSCGACCAHFRVAFHWSETEPFLGGRVPVDLTEALDPHRVVMRGPQARAPRCVALAGEVGHEVACGIYVERPSPCRELGPAWEFGEPSAQCDRARAAFGLPALTPDSWIDPLGPGQAPLPRSA
jgi:Fe-S-cluster containining protein